MVTARLKVLIADNDTLARCGVARLLRASRRWEICGETGVAGEAIELARRLRPALAIVDPAHLEGDGLALLRDLPRHAPKVRMVVFTTSRDRETMRRAFANAVLGYALKSEPEEELRETIEAAAAGRRHTSRGLRELALDLLALGPAPAGAPSSHPSGLSDREHAVWLRLGRGEANRVIATGLGMSVKTVEAHVAHMRRKLCLPGIVELRRHATLAAVGG
ncbi:MAG: response regulator transcription factor [Chthoniobacteraceae bacterium]